MSENNTSPAENTTSRPPELPQGPIYKRAYKSMWIAYVLALLGGAGCFGLHRFYLGYNRSALVILVLTLGGILLPMIGIRSVTLTWWVVSIWVLVDLFLIPSMTRTRNAEIAAEIDRDLKDQI